jgi:hypothetical protein
VPIITSGLITLLTLNSKAPVKNWPKLLIEAWQVADIDSVCTVIPAQAGIDRCI